MEDKDKKEEKFKNIKTLDDLSLFFIYKISVFPQSGNYISNNLTIYDKNHNLITDDLENEIGKCDKFCIINEKQIVISSWDKRTNLIIANIEDLKHVKKQTIIKAHDTFIQYIINGKNENQFITACITFVKVWDNKKNKFINTKIIKPPQAETIYISLILLINNILMVETDKLYFYDIDDKENNYLNSFETPFNAIQKAIKMGENKIAILYVDNRNKKNGIYIIEIKDIKNIQLNINIKLEIKFPRSLCLYLNQYFIICDSNNSIFIYDIKNNYKLVQQIDNSHNENIEGIVELSDGTFASYETSLIKIWK